MYSEYDTFDNHSSSNVVAFAFGNNESGVPSIVMDNIIPPEPSYHNPNIENLPTNVAGKDYKDIIHHILKHVGDKQDILNIATVLNQVAEVLDKRCAESNFTGSYAKKFRPTSPLGLQQDECRTSQTIADLSEKIQLLKEHILTLKATLDGDIECTTTNYLHNTKDQPPVPLDIQENRLDIVVQPLTNTRAAGDVEIDTTVNWNLEDDPEILRDVADLLNSDDSNNHPSPAFSFYDDLAESGGIIPNYDDAQTPTVDINKNTDFVESHVHIVHNPIMDNQVHTRFRRHEFLGDSPTAVRLRGLWNEIECLRPRRNQNATENNDELQARATIRRDEFQDKDIGGQGGRNQRNDFLRLVLQYRDHLYAELDYGHLGRISEKREGQVLLLDFILSNGGRVLRYHSKSSQFYVANPYEALEIMAAKMRDGRLNTNR